MRPGKLGRQPHDPEAFARAPQHLFGAVAPPPVVNRQDSSYRPLIYANDTLPDCTACALANAARAVAALNGYQLAVLPDLVPAFYGACIGCSTASELAGSAGTTLINVLNYQAAHGFDVGYQAPLVAHWGTIDPTDRAALALGIARLGVGYWGVTLRERDMEFLAVWDVQPGRDDGNVVGGHAVIAWDFYGLSDDDHVRLGTWGTWQVTTWAWVRARLDEAYGVVWRQLAKADGTFYSGLTADGLIREL